MRTFIARAGRPAPSFSRNRFVRHQPVAGRLALSMLAALGLAQAASAADATGDVGHGKQLYNGQCSVCHGPSGEGGQGPALQGVVGRKVAAGDFSYSAALQKLDGQWDPERLARFLADPQAMAPGTSMPVKVDDARDRADLVAYLATLKAPAGKEQAATGTSSSGVFGGWRDDAPGRMHHIRATDLPNPAPKTSTSNSSKVVDRPAGVMPKVPDGFTVSVFADGLDAPRKLLTAPNGDILAAQTHTGDVVVLRPDANGAKAASRHVFAKGLDEPFGMVLVPAGPNPKWLYVAETNRIVRFAYRPGATAAAGKPEVVVAKISPTHGGHSNRDMALSKDGQWLYVGVGSSSNIADGMSEKSVADAQAYDKVHGRGAAWDDEQDRAQVRAYALDGSQAHAYATGIRNCSGITVQPRSGDVWCSTNERDRLGDNLVPDYITRVPQGAFFGWPWWYIGDHEDPRLAGQRPDLKGHVRVPDVLLQPHAASLGIAFAPDAHLPAQWKGSAFAAEHGSWNRAERTGSKLVRVLVDANGAPTGAYQDVMTGFVVDNEHVWGRVVGVTPAADGALLVSDDAGGVIWRVAYTGK